MKQVHAQTLSIVYSSCHEARNKGCAMALYASGNLSIIYKKYDLAGLLLPCHYLFYNVYYFLFIQFWVSMTSLKGS